MRLRRFLLFLGLCALGSGCNVYGNLAHDTVFEVMRVTDECCEKVRNRRLAIEAWDEAKKCAPEGSYSSHYARGYKDGYADYLYAGGSGEPVAPPACYWGVRFQTPQGYQAIQDWTDGYQQGAADAQQSGLRDFVVFPVDLPDPDGRAYHPYPIPPGSCVPIALPAPTPIPLEMPAPKPIPQPAPTTKLPPPKQDSSSSSGTSAPRPQPASLAKPAASEWTEKPKPD
jgi:hypothetical protein